MAASIVLTGLSANYAVPGNFLEILFAQGLIGGYQGQRPMCLIGNKTTAGTATLDTVVYGPDTPVPCQTEQDVITLFGAGSELHRGWLRTSPILKAGVPVYMIAVTPSGGVAATKIVTLLTVPLSGGSWRIFVGDDFVDVGFATGDTLASITANAVSLINAKLRWAVTASQTTVTTTSDSITLTAKNLGPRGNWLRAMAMIVPGSSGVSVGTTTTITADAFFTGGTTADSNVTALATLSTRKMYYCVQAAEDATQAGALSTQINSMALPVTGIRQRGFIGSVDTQSNVNTIAVGLNSPRMEVVWQKAGVLTPFELACAAAAVYALQENSGDKPMCNFSGYPRNASEQATWLVPPPRDQTANPSPAGQNIALLNGVTPIAVSPQGTSTYIVKRITSKSLTGANQDYRVRDAHKVTVPDFFGDDYLARVGAQLGGKNLVDDPKQGQPQPPRDTTTPSRLRALAVTLIEDYGPNGKSLLQRTADTYADMIVQREASNANRLSASIPLFVCDILDQTASQILQVG